jgi:regulator of protease activity HflC (stomatin/prohibitin superfamily)
LSVGLLVAIAAVVVLLVLVRSLRHVPADAAVDRRDRLLTLAPLHIRTSDEFAVTFEPTVTVQVTNGDAGPPELASHEQGIEQLTATALRGLVGDRTREQLWSTQAWITTQVQAVLQSEAAGWGLRIGAVEIKLKR